jgi:hypothetical protein
MIRGLAILLLALAATACDAKQDAAEKAQSDARDIAQVEAVQNAPPPLQPIAPEPISFADIKKAKLVGAGCSFRPEGGDGFVMLAIKDAAYLKLDGEMRVHAADSGSPELWLGTRGHYEGRKHVIDLQTTGGEGKASGEKTTDWSGRMTVRDPYDRVVYTAPGTLQCGA